MLKIYQEKPKDTGLFLKLGAIGSGVVFVDLVNRAGRHYSTILAIRDGGVRALPGVPADLAARAGFSPDALDANGCLKVIGQEVEAEKCSVARYECSEDTRDALYLTDSGGGSLVFCAHDGSSRAGVKLDPATTRRLRDTLSAHLAYVEKEGLE